MSRLDVQFLDQGLHRALFDVMPLPVFVVDGDVNILECNAAATRLLVEGRRTKKPGGCGCSPACSCCGLREAVNEASRGQTVTRHCAKMVLNRQGKPARVNLCVSCQPFTYKKNAFVLLVLEGLKK
jgi:nitrogen-specific signal transduction histidine kinase